MENEDFDIITFLIFTLILILLLAGFIISLVFLNRKRLLSYSQSLENLKLNHTKNLLQTQIEIQENTFQHISREIHDNISLSLTLAKLNLNILDWKSIEKMKEQTTSVIELISKSIEDLDNISKGLNADTIKTQGLINATKKEVEKIKQTCMFNITMNIEGEPVFLDAEKELIIFRIIQESFNNIIKHSNAKNVWLNLQYNSIQMDISIQDDGKGFIYPFQQKNEGAGLNNIQTRTKVLNGNTLIESRPGKGTQVRISIPYY